METLMAAILTVGSIVATKALEKTGEDAGHALFEKTQNFLSSLKKKSPDTLTAIEQASQQPLDYGQAVLDVEAAAKENPEIAQTMESLVTATQAEKLPNLKPILQEITQSLKSRSTTSETFNIEKVLNFAKGDINIQNQNINNF